MPMPDVTLEFQSPYDICARCTLERSAHGQYGNQACGLFTGIGEAQDAYLRDQRAHDSGPELAAALRKVTAELRERIERGLEQFTQASIDIDLAEQGVLEAEALLKRIDEGTP